MNVTFFHDGPVLIDEQNRVHRSFLTEEIIERYFLLGDQITIATRQKADVNLKDDTIIQINNVSYENILNFKSIKSYFFNIGKAKKRIRQLVKNADIVIARLPSSIGSIAVDISKELNKPYIIEAVGDPWESLRHHSMIGFLLAPFAKATMKRLLKSSKYVIYVTNEYLQLRYPTLGKGVGISDVILPNVSTDCLDQRINRIKSNNNMITLGTLAVVNIRYKGQQHVIKALAKLKEKGHKDFTYVLVGPGDQQYLRKVAKKYNVEDQVVFLGGMSHEKALKWLETVDVYIQPSETEGMPRALIEAMSKGCCCIGSEVGGIPELLKAEDCYPSIKDPSDLICQRIIACSFDKRIMDANINIEKTKEFNLENLQFKRKCFYDDFLKCEFD